MSGDEPDPDAPDFYGFVGVAPDASQDAIESALTRAKGVYHPDQSSLDDRTASRCFDRVRDAEAVLTDPDSRSAYDTFIERFGPEQGHEAFEHWQNSNSRVDPADWDPETGTDGRTGGGSRTAAASDGTTGTGRGRTTAADTDDRTREARRRAGRSGRRRGARGRRERTAGERAGTRGRAETQGGDGQAGSGHASTPEAGRRWRDSIQRRLAAAYNRIADTRLAVFLPLAALVDRGLDVAVAPGVYVRQSVSIPAQFGLVATLTLGAYIAVAFTGLVGAVLVSLLWLLASVTLYIAGGSLWLFAVAATFFVDGTGPPFYTAVVVLVTVVVYTLFVLGKSGPREETPSPD
jgi:curved DNA-binding protein CbpA